MKSLKLILISLWSVFAVAAPTDANDLRQNELQRSCVGKDHRAALDEIEAEIKGSKLMSSSGALAEASLDADVFVIGEAHPESSAKVVLYEGLQALYDKGYRTLGLEMLNKTAQEQADKFCSGDMSREQFDSVWIDNWSGYARRRPAYIDAVERACQIGFQLLALDFRDQMSLRESEYSRMEARNLAMAGRIVRHIEKTGNRVVALVGSLHAFYRPLNGNEPHINELARTTVPTYISLYRPELLVSTAVVSGKLSHLENPAVCMERTRVGFLAEVGPDAPNAYLVRAPRFLPVHHLIFQKSEFPE